MDGRIGDKIEGEVSTRLRDTGLQELLECRLKCPSCKCKLTEKSKVYIEQGGFACEKCKKKSVVSGLVVNVGGVSD